jgi:aquaporin Z
VFPRKWVVPYWVVQFAGAICAALFLQLMFGGASMNPARGDDG